MVVLIVRYPFGDGVGDFVALDVDMAFAPNKKVADVFLFQCVLDKEVPKCVWVVGGCEGEVTFGYNVVEDSACCQVVNGDD